MSKPVEWGRLTIENQNYLEARAKEKSDGVYSARGIVYRVKGGGVTHCACRREIVACYGNFNTIVGHYEYIDEARKALKKVD